VRGGVESVDEANDSIMLGVLARHAAKDRRDGSRSIDRPSAFRGARKFALLVTR
jgi:hypothetical protein